MNKKDTNKPMDVPEFPRVSPKYSVSNTVGFIKGKSAIRIHRELLGAKRMTGLSFWATGYCISTVGLDEETIRKYIRDQRKFEKG
ncbi:hypothetical protein DSCO28_23030 [Desulfosarcina ovata subsp. sediminis]|uniref:Transposase IS200-like domain-containing protein n=1 Tax=Desulfosarcina ovata subsp. sediminis TaxID=885957 RepID=A0A5K7ZN93_9BACT|nr:hypothetical protein DSCO28_23030 [Desulfosarcina ovata subsp. sediminis]